jgi:hypothetical protein
MLHHAAWYTVTNVSKKCSAVKTSVNIYQSTWCNIPKDMTLHHIILLDSIVCIYWEMHWRLTEVAVIVKSEFTVQFTVTALVILISGSMLQKLFPHHPDWPWGPTSLLRKGYWVSFLGIKRPGRDVNHPPPSSAKVKARVELYLNSLFGPSWLVLGWNFSLYSINA